MQTPQIAFESRPLPQLPAVEEPHGRLHAAASPLAGTAPVRVRKQNIQQEASIGHASKCSTAW